MARVLLVDDEANIRRMLGGLLESEGYAVSAAADADGAVDALERSEPDVALLDLALPGTDGLDLLELIRSRWPALPVVMISGRATLGDAVRATKLGAFHFIEKPLAPEAVLLTVAGAVELRRARELSRQLTQQLGGGTELVGSSAAMREVRRLIAQMAASDARVLITGESGTGKELAATALHGGSVRAAKPFVRVNSAAIPRELVESEMFGHEKGAFTGATETRRGRFELADGGTLFLDEIADLGAGAQAKLLRSIESGQVERIGGERPIPVDVRVIAATNRDLEAEMAEGRFRDDLYYRINVLPLRMPPLRARAEDIPELTAHTFARLRARAGLVPPVLGPDALRRLREYDWPGNVRELANVCERLAILYPERTVGAAQVDAVLPRRAAPGSEDHAALHERLEHFERELIIQALSAAGENVAEAARRLRTDRANLYRRMRRLGIDR